MRRCRHRNCRQPFQPLKTYYYYCPWECRVADVGPEYERDYRGDQRYDRGYWDGTRAHPSISIPPHVWKALAVLVYPDRWGDTPEGVKQLSREAMIWLNTHRPSDVERN